MTPLSSAIQTPIRLEMPKEERNQQVTRIYAVLALLETHPEGLQAKELWSNLELQGHKVSKRTVYRDLEALEAAGFPVVRQGEGSAELWKIDSGAKVGRYLTLSARELLGLYFARGLFSPLRGSSIYPDLEAVFEKLEKYLGTTARAHLEEISKEISFQPKVYESQNLSNEVVETVRAAITEGHVLKCVYWSAHRGVSGVRRLGPHSMLYSKGALYLIAEDLESSEIKLFALSRLSSPELCDEAYSAPQVDPSEWLSNSIGVFRTAGSEPVQVKIRFSGELAPYIQDRIWHPTQRLAAVDGGAIELELRVSITPELVRWITGFGSAAVVMKPEELKSEVRAELEAALERYDRSA
jgi:predicted DNA-binding transcriptional regulator YafY